MPKISTVATDSLKRAPRKRAVRRVVTKSENPPIRRARLNSVPPVINETKPIYRKAPTSLVSLEKRNFTTKDYLLIFGLFVFSTGAAAWIGFSDAGQIDINERITESNEKLKSEATQGNSQNGNDSSGNVTIPVQDTPPVVSSAILSGRGVGSAPVVTEAAPVTEAVSSSTENVSAEAAVEEVTAVSSEDMTKLDSGTPELSQ